MRQIRRKHKLITAFNAVIEGVIHRSVVVADSALVEKIGGHIYVQILHNPIGSFIGRLIETKVSGCLKP